MIVRLKQELDDSQLPKRLTKGYCYRVLAISVDSYRLLDDEGDPVLYDAVLFDVIDATEPDDWVEEYGEDGERYCEPRSLDRYAWEDYHDRKPNAVAAVKEYLKTVQPCRWFGDKT